MSEQAPTDRMTQISYRFSVETDAASEAFDALVNILGQDELSSCDDLSRRVTLTPKGPPGAKPVTVLEATDCRSHVAFEGDTKISDSTANVPFLNSGLPESALESAQEAEWTFHEDDAGQYVEISQSGADSAYGIEITELQQRLANASISVDHTGVSVSQSDVNESVWKHLNAALGDASCLYEYPTGEPWNFVLPATDSELSGGIERFVLGRRPRFELVYDAHAVQPVVQFALQTDCSREEIEALAPHPYGFSPPGLEDTFRIVSVAHPWSGFSMTFHLYFDGVETDWKTGEWLVSEGEQI